MDDKVRTLARRLLSKGFDDLPEREQRVLRRIAERAAISRDVNAAYAKDLSLGDRVADRVAAFGGSWAFIGLFAGVIVLCTWIAYSDHVVRPQPESEKGESGVRSLHQRLRALLGTDDGPFRK